MKNKNVELKPTRRFRKIVNDEPIIRNMKAKLQMYRNIVEESSTAIYICDADTYEIYYVNKASLSMTQRKRGDYEGKKCYEYFCGYDEPCSFCRMKHFTHNTFYSGEFYNDKFDKHFVVKGRLIEWDGKKAFIEYLTDITKERKEKIKLEEFLENIPGGVCMYRWDKNRLFPMYVSKQYEKLIGCDSVNEIDPAKEVDYKHIHPEDLPILKKEILKGLNKTHNLEQAFRRYNEKEKKYVWIKLCANSIVCQDGTQLVYASYTDVDDEKTMEQRLVVSEKSMTAAILHSNLQYWEYDVHNDLAYTGIKVQVDYGLDHVMENFPESWLEKGIVHSEDVERYRQMTKRIKDGEAEIIFDVRATNFLTKEYEWKRIRYTNIYDDNGHQVKAIATAQDIDAYKDLENRFISVMNQNGIHTWEYDIINDEISSLRIFSNELEQGEIGKDVLHTIIKKGKEILKDADEFREMSRRIKNGDKHASCTIKWNEGEEEWRWYKLDYTTIFGIDGRPLRAIGSGIDVTDQIEDKRKYDEAVALQKITAQKATMSVVINLSKNKVISCFGRNSQIPDFSNMSVDGFFEKSRGYVVGNVCKRQHEDVFERRKLLRLFELGIREKSVTVLYTINDNKQRWLDMPITMTQNPITGDIIGFTYAVDVTKERLWTDMTNSVGSSYFDFMMCINVNTEEVLFYNPEEKMVTLYEKYEDLIQKWIEKDSTEFIDLDLGDLFNKLQLNQIAAQLARHREYRFSAFFVDKNGKASYKHHTCTYMDSEKQAIILVRSDFTDVYQSEKKKNEELIAALELAKQANKAKTDFLSAMSHDIRTPMNAIIGMTDLALIDYSGGGQIEESLHIIKKSSLHLLSLINDILDMSRIESGKVNLAQEKFRFSEEIQQIIELAKPLAQNKNQILESSFSVVHDVCVGDAIRIHRVIDNVLGNALKFTPENGKIHFDVREIENDKTKIGLFCIEIKDTGIGMTKEQIEKVYEPFYRGDNPNVSRIEGTGLGLSIVKNIVDYMGGTVSIKSVINQGTTVILEIPLRIVYSEENDQVKEKEESTKAYNIRLKGIHILLAEDHPINQKVAKRIFEKAGATATVAENGQKAYELFTKSKKGTFDAIMMDIQMPIINGYEAAKAIRESQHPQAKTVPIIAMTANAFAEDIQRSFEAGMNDHLAKPIEVKKLFEILSKHLTVKEGDMENVEKEERNT